MADVHASTHPIRLEVTDDLERSRLTVFFRLLLALPLLVWIVLWSLAILAVAIVMWLAVLFSRRVPSSLHGFAAAFVRYSTQLFAYLYLGANPWPGFTPKLGYPVDVEVDPPAEQGRWGAAFRLVLAVPAIALTIALAGGGGGGGSGTRNEDDALLAVATWGGGAAAACAFLAWFACLARGRMPRGLRDLVAYGLGYAAQTYGYVLLLTDRYPRSSPDELAPEMELPAHPVRIEVREGLERSRLTVFFRLLLAVPHLVWLGLWGVLALLAAIAGWLAALATGRLPEPLHRFLAAYVRYASHVYAFASVVGGPFPGFVGAAGSYPVEAEIDPPASQGRLGVAFRLVLALPALVVASAYGGVLVVVAVLCWFAALVTGRVPPGLRDLGAVCIRYDAQTLAYLCLLTSRYPYAAPRLRPAERDEQLALMLAPPAPPEPAA
jgi:hypothetical protein